MSNDPRDQPDLYAPDKGYALSGKIMLSAIVILFFVVILMICLHLYARWYLLNARRRQLRRSPHRRRTHIVFQLDSPNPNPITTATRGLDSSVLKSLPVFVYSSRSHPVPLDCAVCLSEFEENESGRVLPKCNHSFHIECIDMWFDSHSTCPLCRSPVEQYPGESENPSHLIISVNEPVTEPSSSSGLCATCQHEEDSVATLSFEERKPRELMGTSMSIEVPVRNFTDGFESESTGCDSTSSQNQAQSSFRSPISRVLSFKRILSRERRGNSPSSVNLSSCGTVAELDVERGREETATRQTQY